MTLHQPPDKLDDLLADHLAATLDSQRGRARSNFRAGLSAPPASIPISQGKKKSSTPDWLRAGLPSALAAGLAVVVTLQFTSKTPVPVPPLGGSNPVVQAGMGGPVSSPLKFDKLDIQEFSRELNGNVIVLNDNTPVREVRQQKVRHMQWVDPSDKATYTVTQPAETVNYVPVHPY